MPNFTNPRFYLGHRSARMYIVLTHCPFPPENFKEIYFCFYLLVCVSVSLYFRPEEDVGSPGAGITAPQWGCWKLDSLSVEEQCTLLTAEPSLQQCSLLFMSEYKGSCHMFSSVAVANFSLFPSYCFLWHHDLRSRGSFLTLLSSLCRNHILARELVPCLCVAIVMLLWLSTQPQV